MNFGKLGGILKKIGVPLLGAVIPGGGLAAELVKKALNLEAEADEDKMIAAIEANPEAALKLKELEQTHERELIRLAFAMREAELRDTQSARERDIEVQRIRGSNTRADVLAYGSMCGLIGVIASLMFFDIPSAARESLLILVGTLNGIVMTVYTFEFGSSRGSKEKDAVIQKNGS